MTDRIVALSEALSRASHARDMNRTPLWREVWERLESELLERAIGAEDDDGRRHCLDAIRTARRVRRMVEHEGAQVESLQRELDLLEGKKPRAIA